MKVYGYGSKEYFAQQVELAEIKKTLINEAIAARLAEGKIKAEEMAIYAEILQSSEDAIRYAEGNLARSAERTAEA